jgi:hypothetical protein
VSSKGRQRLGRWLPNQAYGGIERVDDLGRQRSTSSGSTTYNRNNAAHGRTDYETASPFMPRLG